MEDGDAISTEDTFATAYDSYLTETTLVIGGVLNKPIREDPLALVSPQPDRGLLSVHRARRCLSRIEQSGGSAIVAVFTD